MSNARKPSSARAAVAAEKAAEKAERNEVTVPFEGHDYVLDRAAAEDVEFFERVEDEKYVTALRQLLGPTQWAVYKVHHPKLADLEPFMGAVLEALGQGNSSASPTSPESTARPSNPISGATTESA